MATAKRKLVKFCPLCGGAAEETDSQFSRCPTCKRLFKVELSEFREPEPGGRTHYQECLGKRRHETMKLALDHASQLEDIPNREWANLTVYLCRFGDHWHVGHRRQKRHKSACWRESYLVSGLVERNICRTIPLEVLERT